MDMNQHCLSHTALVHSLYKLDPALFGQYMGSEKVISRKIGTEGWVHLLHYDQPVTFQHLQQGIITLDQNLLQQDKYKYARTVFYPLSDRDDDKIRAGANHVLIHKILDVNGDPMDGAEIWQMRDIKPPRKRAIDEGLTVLIPSLKRLNHQLDVDFSVDVHGTEGKRRREPVKPVYDTTEKKKAKRRAKRAIDHDELMQHAQTLVSLSSGNTTPNSHDKRTGNVIDTLSKAMDAIHKAHSEAMACKDETIRAMQETIHTQNSVILALQALN
jgi:hypothetical protein